MAKSPKICLSPSVMEAIRNEIIDKEIKAQTGLIASVVKEEVKRYLVSDFFKNMIRANVKDATEGLFGDMSLDELCGTAFSPKEYDEILKNAARNALKNMSKI